MGGQDMYEAHRGACSGFLLGADSFLPPWEDLDWDTQEVWEEWADEMRRGDEDQ